MIILLSYVFYFIASSASSLQRRWLAVKKDEQAGPRGQIRLAFEVMLFLVVGGLFFPFFSPFYFSGNWYYLIFLSVISGLFGMGYFISNYIAQRHVDAGVTTILSHIYTPVTILFATVFLHEGLSLKQIIGIAILLTAIVIVSKKHHIGTFRFDKYFWMMIASGVMLGILLVAERALQKTTGFSAGVLLSWFSQCAFLGLATLIYQSKHTYTKSEVLTTGALRFLQGLSYVVLIWVVGNLSLVASVITFKVVIVFAAAALFLGEREDWQRKLVGSVIAVIGLLLMR